MALEKPEYEVLFSEGKIEYRQYQPYLVAETEVIGERNRNDSANEGFMRLFKYITGTNSSRSKIDMTAPVQQSQVSEKIAMTAPVQQTPSTNGWRVAFMLPSKFSLANAPVPLDERINIREVTGRKMIAIRYSGRWTEKNVEKYETLLREHLTMKGISPIGNLESAVYNAPFTPPFLRRNELMLEVATLPTANVSVSLAN